MAKKKVAAIIKIQIPAGALEPSVAASEPKTGRSCGGRRASAPISRGEGNLHDGARRA